MLSVLACGSFDGDQNLVNHLPVPPSPPHHSTSCSRAFLCAEQSSSPIISSITSLSLCSALPATELLEEGQVTSPLSSPINCSRLNKAQCLFNVCVAWIDIRDVKLPSPGWGTAQLGGSHTGVSQVRCRLWGVRSCKRTGREQAWVGSWALQPTFPKVPDDQMSSSVHRNGQWKAHSWNRKEFSLSQTADCSKGDSVPIALRNCSAEAWCPAQSSTSS